MIRILLLSLLLILSNSIYATGNKDRHGEITVYVDRIEINTFYDQLAFPSFSQIIFYDWKRKNFWSNNKGWHVREWKMYKEELWDKNDQEHKKKWMEEYRKLCDSNNNYSWAQRESKYKGKYVRPWEFWPRKNKDNKYELTYIGRNGKCFRVIATSFLETHTQHDPERKNIEVIPESERIPLGKIMPVKKESSDYTIQYYEDGNDD